MGIAGAAAATVISQTVAMIMSIYDIPRLLRSLREEETDLSLAFGGRVSLLTLFDWELLITMLRFAAPAAIQQSIVSVGSVVVQATINSFGTIVMAACAGASKIINLTTVVAINYSNAFSSYVGQNIGARKIDRIYDGLQASLLCCGGISLVMTVLLEVFAKPLMGLFVSGENAADAIATGAVYICVTGAFLILFAFYMLTKAVFKGSGDMGWFLFVTLLSFAIRLVLTTFLAPRVGVFMIWWSGGIGWVIAYLVSLIHFSRGGWKNKRVLERIHDQVSADKK